MKPPRDELSSLTTPALLLGTGGILFVHFFFSLSYISSRSMQSALEVHDCLIVNRMAFRLRKPWRGEIVIFLPPQADKGQNELIKRIVAVGGDTIALRDGQLLINGLAINEPYISRPTKTVLISHSVKENTCFVMGDNRNNSIDSRIFGDVPESLLIGRAEFRIWPFDKIGRIPGTYPEE